jgi:hypothetical protein
VETKSKNRTDAQAYQKARLLLFTSSQEVFQLLGLPEHHQHTNLHLYLYLYYIIKYYKKNKYRRLLIF